MFGGIEVVEHVFMLNLLGSTYPRLDLGDGMDVELIECPRSKLRQQCIIYLGPVCALMNLFWPDLHIEIQFLAVLKPM